ncbi:MAG: DNA ligase D [Bacteroidota bacterium]|nr:DNA ligase D [Bacteroidota bacterium]
MLATLVDKPFDAEDWLYEIKWDGYRAVAHLRDTKVGLWSRNQKSFDEKFYPIHAALQTLGLHAVLDGEIIVSTPEGISNFGMLQNWRSEADGQLLYYVFDLLWLDGYSLLDLPLTERRALLEKALPAHPLIRISEAFATSGLSFYQTAKEMKLEGIMAKKADSVYVPGERSKDWLKIKVGRRQEVVIGGYTKNEGSAKSFSALLVGVFKNKKLQYTGKIGTGFSDQLQKEMLKKFTPLVRKTCPFTDEPDVNKPSRFRHDPPHAKAIWLKPQLVCEVAFTEMTTDGVMRHPSFEGMREDKPAQQVVAEKAAAVENVVEVAAPEQERNTLLNPSEEQQQRKINGHPLKFTNLSKLFWPKEKISKRDLLNYYYQVAPYMLPYLKNRPQSLNRHPGGINAPGFYQKDITGKAPDWIKTFPYTSEGRQKNFLVCTNEASLLYMASLGCIEINPWSSTVLKPQNPDWCIIDLDPTEKSSFDQVIETAQATHALLEAATVDHYCKTSGSTGIHIYIPLGAKYDYEASKEFGRLIAKLVHEALPEFTSIERATKQRRGKIYIDFLQNRPQATLAAPYSLRPKPGATVSMPLRWEEVKKGLRMSDFNIHNAVQRIRESDDIFKPVLGKGIDMKKAIQSLVDSP